LSAAGSKAGLKVGSAPWQFPADGLAEWGKLAPVGIAVASMRPATLSHILAGRGADYREHEKTGGRVASCLFGFRVRLWVDVVLPYQYPPFGGWAFSHGRKILNLTVLAFYLLCFLSAILDFVDFRLHNFLYHVQERYPSICAVPSYP